MLKYVFPVFPAVSLLICFCGRVTSAQLPDESLVHRPWFSARTAHFEVYSCATTQQVSRVLEKLEQFRSAYLLLAGAQAVASPPIVVVAFPEHKDLKSFLPLYDGKPANMSAFFTRGSDENLIVLSLADSEGMNVIFHEYAHLLFRRNDQIWPLWLKEGMAEIYSTMEVAGPQVVRLGAPIEHHLRLLGRKSLMPLKELFAISRESSDYNEGERQGIFYSESWLLCHYLMIGDNGARKTRFGQLTTLLRQGQAPEQAFTNAMKMSLAATEADLKKYLERGKFESLTIPVRAELTTRPPMAIRPVAPAEVCFRLGDLLLRLHRLDEAEAYFQQSQTLAPLNPLAPEGMGVLAAYRDKDEEALRYLQVALQRGSRSFLAHYIYAREKYRIIAHHSDQYSKIDEESAAEIRSELHKALTLMPDFAPAHHLLGFFEMVQGEDLPGAEKHLQRAIQLEPENPAYQFALAQVQLRKQDVDGAKRTLQGLRTRYVDEQVRSHAEELLREIGRNK